MFCPKVAEKWRLRKLLFAKEYRRRFSSISKNACSIRKKKSPGSRGP